MILHCRSLWSILSCVRSILICSYQCGIKNICAWKESKSLVFSFFSKQIYALEIVQELHAAQEHNLPDFIKLCLNDFSYKESEAQRHLFQTSSVLLPHLKTTRGARCKIGQMCLTGCQSWQLAATKNKWGLMPVILSGIFCLTILSAQLKTSSDEVGK